MKIELQEYESRDIRLPQQTYTHLAAHHDRYLEIRPTGSPETYQIRAKQYVGTIVAPGIEIRLTPKCPTRNLLYMLSYAYRLAHLRKELAGYALAEDLFEFVVEIFLKHVEGLIARGPRRDYRLREERLRFLRGKIQVGEMWRRIGSVDLRVPCEFDEFTEDVRDNRLIRYTLDCLCGLPIGTTRQLLRVRRCRSLFAGVRPTRYLPSEIDRFEYDRLNEHYEPIHQLCRLILEASGFEQVEGTHSFGTFLVDMDRLFEAFVAEWLAEKGTRSLRLDRQVPCHLDTGRKILLRPDLCFYSGDSLAVVADTKYKSTPGGTFSNPDVYQILAYCRGLRVRTGYLIYPSWNGPPRRFPVSGGENTIVLDGVNLGGAVAELDEDLSALAGRIAAEARGDRELASTASAAAATA
jgi:5-methylcytosine-specific restriction enzyme subunit McrC